MATDDTSKRLATVRGPALWTCGRMEGDGPALLVDQDQDGTETFVVHNALPWACDVCDRTTLHTVYLEVEPTAVAAIARKASLLRHIRYYLSCRDCTRELSAPATQTLGLRLARY